MKLTGEIFLKVIFALAFTPAIAQQPTTRVFVDNDPDSYKTLRYEVGSKRKVNDSLSSSNVFITITQPNSAFYRGDTLYMYALAVANHEHLTKARFFIHYEPFILANTLDLQEFDLNKIQEEVNPENWDIIYESLFGILVIDPAGDSWKKELHSDNITCGGIKQNIPMNKRASKRIYQLAAE